MSQLCFHILFPFQPILGSIHERENRVTLFHGLTNSKTTNLGVKLTLPELPNTTNPDLLGLKVPHWNEVSEMNMFLVKWEFLLF